VAPLDPLIRIICLIVFSLNLAAYNRFSSLAAATGLLVIAWIARRQGPTLTAWRLLKRAKWLLVSLAVVYLAFVPGEALFPALGAGSPSAVGVQQTLLRVGAIVVLILSVDVALHGQAAERLLAAFYRLIRPFAWLGFSPERAAVRGWLTLHYSTELAMPAVEMRSTAEVSTISTRLARGVDRMVHHLSAVLAPPSQCPVPIQIELGPPTPQWQWALPVLLFVLFAWVNQL